MIDGRTARYNPDLVSPPGETLAETLQNLGMSQAQLAERTGRPRKTINEIIRGKAAITPETAIQLERALGVPAVFWNNREHRYREYKARSLEQSRLKGHVDWLAKFPVKSMIRLGWVKPGATIECLRALLNFFGVASPLEWKALWEAKQPAFRRTTGGDEHALIAWMRQGELQAQQMRLAPFSESAFKSALTKARALSREGPEVFEPGLRDLCAGAGVAVVFVPELPRTKVYGVTHWLTPEKAVIQLSLRYKTDDHLWFTFFHEACHILRHRKRDIFLEIGDQDGPEEQEANEFAEDWLIPRAHWTRFSSGPRFSKAVIRRFARETGVAAGIVVGRLQHEGYLPQSFCNDLKRRLRFATTN